MYKRILMKLSGEALGGDQGIGFDHDKARKIISQIKELKQSGVELGLVIGGGNIWRGRSNTDMDMVKSHNIGMMGTIVNSMYMAAMLNEAGLKARAITPFAIPSMTEGFFKDDVMKYLADGEILVFGGGCGQPFLSTDTGAVMNALKIEADALFLAKSVDGVYDSDPKENPNAVKFDKITFSEVLDKKLKVIDLPAASLCLENNIDAVVFDLNVEGNIMKNVRGEITGTLITNE